MSLLRQGVLAQGTTSINALKKSIIEELDARKGVFSVAFYDLSTRRSFTINGDTVFHAASTMKTPVMVEVFRQSHAGNFSIHDSVTVKNDFKSIVDGSVYHLNASDDSDTGLYHLVGQKMAIYDLMYRMIINSSNLATNLIIDLVGAQNVMHTLKGLGIRRMKVLRGVEDQKAYDLGMNNVTTAPDLMRLFRSIASGKTISREASDSMIHVLKDQRHNSIIPALLPKNVTVAHKTGSVTGVHHDSGIVYLPDGKKYVLVLLSKNIPDDKAAVASMAKVSRLIYEYVVNH